MAHTATRKRRSLKWQRILLILGLVLLVVQIPWYFIAGSLAGRTEVKTTAQVIRIESTGSGCTGRLCDSSKRQYPVYEYYDQQGRRHEADDRYFGAYKSGNPLGKLFLKRVGDRVPAYYTKTNPEAVLFMASPYAYIGWLWPLYIAIFVLLGAGLLFVVQKINRRYWPAQYS